jgi:hypothetical protein
MSNHYAGIGSRETTVAVLNTMRLIGHSMAMEGWVLRSGGADGADTAFEKGCNQASGSKQIFLPWRGFNGSDSMIFDVPEAAYDLVRQFHPAPDRLSQGAMKLMARNCQQILGPNLDDPTKLVICWTVGAKGGGGTGQAIRMAKHYGIPVVDMCNQTTDESVAAINGVLERYE